MKEATEEMEVNPAKYDLTPRMAPFLDKHLLLNLLDFLQAEVTCQFQPGILGLNADYSTGLITEVSPDGQCARSRVRIGWTMVAINDKPYTKPLLDERIKGGEDYNIRFSKGMDQHVFKKEDLTKAELKVVLSTNMIDLAEEKYRVLDQEVPEALNDRKEDIVAQVEEVKEFEFSLLQKLENQIELDKMAECKSLEEVCDKLDVSKDQVEGLIRYAKLVYECGEYRLSSLLLQYYRKMRIRLKEDGRTKEEETSKTVVTLWGAIASLFLSVQNDADVESAAENIDTLMNYLDTAKLTQKERLVQKTWLLHWSLWAMFRFDTVPLKVLNIFISEKSLSIVSLSCPHLLRYVAAALVLQKRLKLAVKDTVAVIHAESHAYSDPLTRFLVALFIDLDFECAQEELQQCEAVCKIDFFLAHLWETFEENARLMIFETYCQIHQCIYIEMIAKRLNMKKDEAELWIVKLIQSAKLDARIDSENGRVVMSKAPPSVYQQVIEKTKNLSFRSTMLLSNLEKKEQKEQLAKS